MKKFKRFLALAMTAVLAFTPAVTANATEITEPTQAEGTASGDGKLEGYVDTDVFRVVLPTSVDADTFKFIMDPQGLIAETSGEAYAGADFEENASVYFNTASADASGDYKSTSKEVKVINKGTVAVDLSVVASVSGIDGITMAESATFASGDTTPGLYLALKEVVSADASGDVEVLASTGATLEAELAAADDEYYTFSVDASGNYSYALKDEYVSGDVFETYSFALTGACNTNADWSDLTEAAPKVSLTWTLEEHSDEDENAIIRTTGDTSAYTTTFVASVSSIEWVTKNDVAATGTLTRGSTNNYTITGTSVTLLTTTMRQMTSGKSVLKFTLSDGTTQNLTFIVR